MASVRLKTYSDGGARGNPGPAAIGVLICNAKDEVLIEHQDVIGKATNNIAEYCALIAALALAKELGAREVESYLDSELVVKQLGRVYRVKTDHIRELISEVRKLEAEFERVSYQHLPRTNMKLRRADKLVNLALDEGKA